MRILQDSSAPASAEDPPPADAESPEAAADSEPPPADESPPPPPPGRKNLRSPPPAVGEAQSESQYAVWNPPRTNQISHEHIVGAAVGAGLFFLLVLIICLCCRRRKKSAKRDDGYKYYSNKNAGANYYNNMAGQKQWQTTGLNYMDGKKTHHQPPPQISSMTTQHWMAAPPPPPPMSAQSSAGFAGPPMPPAHPTMTWAGYNNSTFTYNDLASATGGFAEANLLGQGGFGYVHKGMLPNGKEVAVKSLKLNSGQGEREFQAEVDIISRVHHRHLVSLVGYCISGARRMLVYEYVPNSSLEDHLHGEDRPVMDCQTRIKIALGAAKGFAYLHEDCHPRIIHRDIKAANILLDNNNEAKVADFGLAKLSSEDNTHISTRIMGTFGYLAPEYASSGKLTEKSDVYSFGIVLLELITGRRPVDMTRDDEDDSLVDWARPVLTRVAEGGSYEELVDPRLERNYDHDEMLRLVISAAACIRQSSRKRPKMSQVVRALEGDMSLDDLQEGMKASRSHGSLSSSSSEYDLQRYQKTGRSNQSFTSSELGAGSEVGVGSEYANSQASGTNSNELTRLSPGDRYPGP